MIKIGDTIRIDYMKDEPHYTGRTGIVRSIDDLGQIFGSWGGLAIVPGVDSYTVLETSSAD